MIARDPTICSRCKKPSANYSNKGLIISVSGGDLCALRVVFTDKERISILEDVPDKCPMRLEHLMAKNK